MSDSVLVEAAAADPLFSEAPRSSLVADALDALGYRHQCIDAGLVALTVGDKIFGRAFPVQAEPADRISDPPYVGLLAALDNVGAGEVFVLATGGITSAAAWGELCTAACVARGAAGAVIDGPLRDAELIADLAFPVFCRGRLPADANGRFEVTGHGQPVTLGGVRIAPRDILIGDADGLVVVPQALAHVALEAARKKGERENLFREAVSAGLRPSEAFRRYGVL